MAQTPTFDDIQSVARERRHARKSIFRHRAGARLEGPYALVVLFMFLYYVFPMLAEFPGVSPLRPMMVLMIVIALWLIFEKAAANDAFVLSWPESHALVFLLGAGILSAVNSYWPGLAVQNTIELAKGVGLYFLIINVINDRQRLRSLYWWMTLGGGLAAVSTLRRYFSGWTDSEGRAIYAGVFSNANDVAMALIVIIPLAVALYAGSRAWGRLVLAAVVGVCLAAIFFTFSRGGLVGLAAAMGVLFMRSTPPMRRALGVAALVILLMLPMYSGLWGREDSFAQLTEDHTFQNRLVSIQVGVAMFIDSPVFGIGMGASAIGFPLYAPMEHQGDNSLIHNTYAQVLGELGALGTLAFLVALGFALSRVELVNRRARRRGDHNMVSYSSGLESSLAGFMMCAMGGPYLNSWVPIYLVAISSAMRKINVSESAARGGLDAEAP